MINVCICSHNSRLDILDKVIKSIAAQDAPRGTFQLTLVDNASAPPIDENILLPIRTAGIAAHILQEPVLGHQRTRICAIKKTSAEWILWVDDDNELFPNFVSKGQSFIAANPQVGCFGGRLLLPPHLTPPKSIIPFLPYLAIRDYGDKPIIQKLNKWDIAEPPGAGAWVRRSVINEYLRLSESSDAFYKLGRTGGHGLSSCDDSCMMRCAGRLGLSCAYVPDLKLWHHISPSRFRLNYLLRLMCAYGHSHLILESVFSAKNSIIMKPSFFGMLKNSLYSFKNTLRHGLFFALGQACYQYGSFMQMRQYYNLNNKK